MIHIACENLQPNPSASQTGRTAQVRDNPKLLQTVLRNRYLEWQETGKHMLGRFIALTSRGGRTPYSPFEWRWSEPVESALSGTEGSCVFPDISALTLMQTNKGQRTSGLSQQ